MLRYLKSWIDQPVALAAPEADGEAGGYAAQSPGGDPQLLSDQSTAKAWWRQLTATSRLCCAADEATETSNTCS